MKAACTVLALTLFTVGAAYANPLPEGYAGMDQNGDLVCNPEEMGFELTAGDAGMSFGLDPFFDMIGGGVLSFGCVFCVQDKNLVSDESWTFATPAGWTNGVFRNSDEPGFPYPVSSWIGAAYPNYRCYAVEATDFTFSSPLASPFPLGTFTFTYAAAEEGCVGFVIDGANTGFLTTSFITGTMELEGQTCPPYECGGISSTEKESWGGVKALFR
ncbi:MAG: hypothetical protein ABIK65_01830 [Candidatus Eisenbacteria bacterium]